MPFWQRSLITLLAMLAVSFVIGFLWRTMFGFGLPDYASGVVGGAHGCTIVGIHEEDKAKTNLTPYPGRNHLELKKCLKF